MTDWRFGPSDSELQVRTTATGAAAKLGHRLTLSVTSWQATVTWAGDEPSALELVADAASLEVLRGEGGATPLSGPEKAIIRANATKSLGAQKFPTISFATDTVSKTADGYRLAGKVTIHGTVKRTDIALHVEDRGDSWQLSADVAVRQSDFGIKPFSMMMGALKVADPVTVSFQTTRAKNTAA